MNIRKKKILILGADGFNSDDEATSVTSVEWYQLDAIANVADFDTVIVSLLGHRSFTDATAKTITRKLTLDVTCAILANGGQVVVLGDPRLNLAYEAANGRESPFRF